MKKENGITLVALVVTIIVLLILAGVTISLTINGNGIFNNAKTAGEKYTAASDAEKTEMNGAANQMENIMKAYNLTTSAGE